MHQQPCAVASPVSTSLAWYMVRLNCIPIASTSAAAPKLRSLWLLLLNCVLFSCCSSSASTYYHAHAIQSIIRTKVSRHYCSPAPWNSHFPQILMYWWLYISFRLPAYYRGVLVYVPFGATALGVATLSTMLLLEWCHRKYLPLSAQALTPSIQYGHPDETDEGMTCSIAWRNWTTVTLNKSQRG